MTLLPSNKDAERGLLSIALQWPDQISNLLEAGGDELFYDPSHRRIWSALASMSTKNRHIEPIGLIATLREAGHLDAIGGAAAIMDLTIDVASTALAPDLIRMAVKALKARRVARTAETALRSILQAGDDPDQVASRMDADLKQILLEISGDRLKNWPRVLNEFVAVTEERVRENRATAGISTGFPCLDKLTGGMKPGELWVIAARPSVGKTAFSMQIAQEVAKAGNPIVFFSAEMEAVELATRVIAKEAKMDSLDLLAGDLKRIHMIQISEAVGRQMRLPIYVDDRPSMGLSDVVIGARRAVQEHGAKVVFVDYLQLIKEEDGSRSREDAVRRLSGGLKQLAKEMQIPVVALAQLNRQMENRDGGRPKSAHLRDSGSIEQDANVVFLLHRPGHKTPSGNELIEGIVDKARGGRRGEINYHFHGPSTHFSEVGMKEDDEGF